MKQRTGFVSNSSSCSFAIAKSVLTDAQIAELCAWAGSHEAFVKEVEDGIFSYGGDMESRYNQLVNKLYDERYDKDTSFSNDEDYGDFSPLDGKTTLFGTCSYHVTPTYEFYKRIGLDESLIDWTDS